MKHAWRTLAAAARKRQDERGDNLGSRAPLLDR